MSAETEEEAGGGGGVETGAREPHSKLRMRKSNALTVDWISRRTETSRGSEGVAGATLEETPTGGALAEDTGSLASPRGPGGRDVPVGETWGVEVSSMTESASDSASASVEGAEPEGVEVVE